MKLPTTRRDTPSEFGARPNSFPWGDRSSNPMRPNTSDNQNAGIKEIVAKIGASSNPINNSPNNALSTFAPSRIPNVIQVIFVGFRRLIVVIVSYSRRIIGTCVLLCL